MIQGVYKIVNKLNNKVYVGQSINIKSRFQSHKDTLKTKYNHPLYNSIRKYGLDNFEFIILEEINNVLLLDEREQYWIEYYKSYDSNYGYNLMRLAQRAFHSDETKNKMSVLARERMKNKDLRAKISKTVLRTVTTPKFKETFKKRMKEVTNTVKHRKVCSDRQKRLLQNPEYRKNLVEKSSNNWKNPEYRKNNIEKQKLRNTCSEVKKQMSEITKNLWEDPSYRAKMFTARKTLKHKEKMKTLWESEAFKEKRRLISAKKKEARLKEFLDNGFVEKVKDLYLTQNMKREVVAKLLDIKEATFGVLLKDFGLQKSREKFLELSKVGSEYITN